MPAGDPCSMFKSGTKSYCICNTLRNLGTSTEADLARRCGASISTVRHVVYLLEKQGYAKRIYYNDVKYTVVWSHYYSFLRDPPRKW